MGLIQEFKDFAVKGNVVDMAVGVIIGQAFGKIISSIVADVIMPPIGLLVGGVDFSGLKIVLKAGSEGVAAVTLNYGMFIQQCFDFFIVAASIFMAVKAINKLRTPAVAAPVPPSAQEVLLAEIRDLLKANGR